MRLSIFALTLALLSGPLAAQSMPAAPTFPTPGTFCGPFQLCAPETTRDISP